MVVVHNRDVYNVYHMRRTGNTVHLICDNNEHLVVLFKEEHEAKSFELRLCNRHSLDITKYKVKRC